MPMSESLRTSLVEKAALLPTWIYGCQGHWNQSQQVKHAFDMAARGGDDTLYFELGAAMLLWAWQERPLDKALLQPLLQADSTSPFLPPVLRTFAKLLNARLLPPETPEPLMALEECILTENPEDLLSFIAERMDQPHGLLLFGLAYEHLLDCGAFQEAGALIALLLHDAELAPLVGRLQAERALYSLPPEQALTYVQQVAPASFGWWRTYTQSRVLEQSGALDKATTLLLALWRDIPWHVNILLKLHDRLFPPPPPANPQDWPDVCALLYSWNNGPVLKDTLDSLRVSELGNAQVFVLDNGSTDEAPQLLQQARDEWTAAHGEGKLNIVTLPSNIGAPAARNWLLSLEKVRACQWTAFLDDDTIVSKDWLAHLIALGQANPQSGAVGCRITGHTRPYIMQAADFHTLDPALCASGFSDVQEHIFVTNNCIGLRDNGMFEYSRPAASVTGCCHLLNQRALEAAGVFDIRFAPTQFDDLERDLRSFLAGYPAYYHGHVRIKHVQHSSLRQAQDRARQAHIHGNKLKLEHLLSPEQAKDIAAKTRNALLNDAKEKYNKVLERVAATP